MTSDLVTGRMTAYRAWTLVGAELAPMTGGEPSEGGWSSATAIADCMDLWGNAPHPGQRAPVPGCTCGLYAYYRLLTVMLDSAPPVDPVMAKLWPELVAPRVFGAVEVSGRVILATRGLKAERMRILGLVMPDRSTAALVAARYNVPTYASHRALLLDFPPYDYSGLVDVDKRDIIIPFQKGGDTSASLTDWLASIASLPPTGTTKLGRSLSIVRRWWTRRRKASGGS